MLSNRVYVGIVAFLGAVISASPAAAEDKPTTPLRSITPVISTDSQYNKDTKSQEVSIAPDTVENSSPLVPGVFDASDSKFVPSSATSAGLTNAATVGVVQPVVLTNVVNPDQLRGFYSSSAAQSFNTAVGLAALITTAGQ